MRARLVLFTAISALAALAIRADARPWTTQDSVRTRYFVEGWGIPDFLGESGAAVTASPDRAHFFFAYRHGDLGCDCTVYQLEVYAVADVAAGIRRGAAPAPVARMVRRSRDSDFFRPAIGEPRWASNARIEFLGIDDAGVRQLYALDIGGGKPVLGADLAPFVDGESTGISILAQNGGSRIMFVQTGKVRDQSLEAYPAVEIVDRELTALGSRYQGRFALVGQRAGAPPFLLADDVGFGVTQRMVMSPDGRWAVADLRLRQEMPEPWLDYAGGVSSRPPQFFIADLEARTAGPVFDAPLGQYTSPAASPSDEHGWARRVAQRAIWAPDSRRVLLVNTAIPFAGASSPSEVGTTSYIVDYDPRDRAWRVLQPVADPARGRYVGDVRWLSADRVLVRYRRLQGLATPQSLAAAPKDGGTLHVWRDGSWRASQLDEGEAARLDPPAAAPPLPSQDGAIELAGVRVSLRQAANVPPAIVAAANGREIALTGPDPALADVERAIWREIGWPAAPGRAAGRVGLLMPIGHRPGDPPPPLVVQVYRWTPDLFRPDGPYANAYAAQALAAHGIAVVNLTMPMIDDPSIRDTPAEGRAMVERVDALVDHLAASGLVDPSRVGMIGFSRGGFATSYVISHPGRTPIAASVIADAFTASYGNYIADIAMRGPGTGVRGDYERLNGGSFWRVPETWLAEAPGFNMHRVQGATLFSFSYLSGGIAYLEQIAALRANGRPVEALMFPVGSHQLIRPQERLASLDATLSWMRFWLKGELPEDRQRAMRWQRMGRVQPRH